MGRQTCASGLGTNWLGIEDTQSHLQPRGSNENRMSTLCRGHWECVVGQGCSGGKLRAGSVVEVQASFPCELGTLASVERAYEGPSGGRGVALSPISSVAGFLYKQPICRILHRGVGSPVHSGGMLAKPLTSGSSV